MPMQFNYEPHAAQRRLHADRHRFQTVCCGRRWGKTRFAAAKMIDEGGGVSGGDYGWIAPTYLIAERGLEALREIGGDAVNIHGQNPAVAEFDGACGHVRILFLSAERPQGILGFGFRGIVLDESAMIPQDVWTTYIRPTLSDKMGWATLISTPRGRNWFFDLFTRGTDPDQPNYAAFTFPSRTNPYFPAEEWEEAKTTLPADIFRQEYEAEFLEDSAGVFRGVEACLFDGEPARGGPLVIGIDLAKHGDFTVLTALDAVTGAGVAQERFNLLDWPIQKERIADFCKRHPGDAYMEVNSIGDVIFDDLKTVVPGLRPWVTTHHSKTQIIQRLIVDVEQRRISWPRSWQVLTDEMKRYEYRISSGGTITYNAPAGYHDDCVMSLALANAQRKTYVAPPENPVVFGGKRTGLWTPSRSRLRLG